MLEFARLDLAVVSVFALAGFVKGVIGLGLPTISVGLLGIVMTTAEAARLLVLPSLLTNIWQAFAGPALRPLLARLWTMFAGIGLGAMAGAGLLAGEHVALASAALGVTLMVYAVFGLAAPELRTPPRREVWVAPLVGLATGLVTGATGIFVIPAVPYLQSLGLDKDELVQALGLSFLVSTVALAFALAGAGEIDGDFLRATLLALVAALAGMGLGQLCRDRLSGAAFRRWFFIGLGALGLWLTLRALVRIVG